MKKPARTSAGKAGQAATREARLAEALRANLKRRKAQSKTRDQAKDDQRK
ncbi:MAG: hypothetical protein AAGA19_00870 [Pseudomonadota bacterium]